ncbi:MAG TPA: tRNA (adenosine(37)-N6)-dimethylallyltransferase MiaA [Intrasporangium sp.]|uniref:tRNA (adenosine(37)-N6)-dimethylallyltransferase MiaA n=1 Tax=Intrasporangium sp. TaxID=1925024 RepID=UPI002D785690|nr:tRNA (adenosine(37)-N6)-dimethylallyltransferase MiaA [Intrasporangium sp.]HET7397950.1 tRNA (adenosine(37)-N6)-dimethylallyltransferase MiaA [Intrasporangium sp.]
MRPTSTSPEPPASVIAVVGATASGKSDLGLELAQRLGGEVVNADAMQLYRGMDIGTAKLPVGERHGIPHHELDVLEVTEEASVARYQVAARADVAAIRARGRAPILVGGSGLYLRAALDRLDIPPTDPALRSRLEEEALEQGASVMHARLARLDPAAAAGILPANVRRVVRALEVVTLTGRPFSATMPTRRFLCPTTMLGLRVSREVLDERIDRRVERMWRDGLLEEVRGLLPLGLREGFTASRAIGYRQAVEVLDGVSTAEAAIAETARATRRYARRQESWFRADPRIVWLDAQAPDLVERALDVVCARALRHDPSTGDPPPPPGGAGAMPDNG